MSPDSFTRLWPRGDHTSRWGRREIHGLVRQHDGYGPTHLTGSPMPSAPKPKCSVWPCPNDATYRGKCDRHAKESDQSRGTAAERGYDDRWRKVKTAWLMDHQACERCGAQATVVHHRIPHKGDRQLFWNQSLWEALCKRCHDTHTATHDGAFGRPSMRQQW